MTDAVLSGLPVPYVLCCLEQAVVLSLSFSPLPALHLPQVDSPSLKWKSSFVLGTIKG